MPHRGPASRLSFPNSRPGGEHFTHHLSAPAQVLDIPRKNSHDTKTFSPHLASTPRTTSPNPPTPHYLPFPFAGVHTLTHTPRERGRSKPHLPRPPLSTATTPAIRSTVKRRQRRTPVRGHAAPGDNPEGSGRVPRLHAAPSSGLLPKNPASQGRFYFPPWSRIFFLRTPAVKGIF